MSDTHVGVVDAHLKVGVGLMTAGGSVTGGHGMYGVRAEAVQHWVTPGSGRLTLGLWVRRGQGVSLFNFLAFLMVLSHNKGMQLSLFISVHNYHLYPRGLVWLDAEQ